MGRKPTGKPPGRPRKEVNFEQFKQFCIAHCTIHEIAAFFGMNTDTLQSRIVEHYGVSFSDKYHEYASIGKISLRRKQWKKALEDESEKMLQWLGINELGQKSKTEDSPVQINITSKEIRDMINKKEPNESNQ